MNEIFSAVTPIFICILVGYLVFRAGILPQEGARLLGRFVLMVALPSLIFRAVSQRTLGEVFNVSYLGASALGALACGLVVWLMSVFVLRRSAAGGVIRAMGATCPNSGYVGYPIMLLVVGATAEMALALSMLVENIVIIPALLILAESTVASGRKPSEIIFATLQGLIRNPMILAIAAGALVSLSGIKLPFVVMRSVDMLANASAAVALAAIGGALVGLKPKGLAADIFVVVAGKLLLHPACVMLALMLFPPLEPKLYKALIITSSAPMITIYPLLAERYGETEVGTASMLAATVFSFFTMSLMLWLI